MEIKILDPNKITREDWNRYHEFRNLRHMETNPGDPYQPDEIIEKSIIQDYKSDQFLIRRYIITENNSENIEKQIGSAFLALFTKNNPSYDGNKHIMQADIAVLPEYRKKGIARKILLNMIDYCKNYDIKLLITNTSEPAGKEFLQHIGAKLALEGKENRLQLVDVDWNMVNDWIIDGEKRNPETKIVQFTEIPEDLIEQYAPMYTGVMNQQPFDSLEIDKIILTPETLRKREAELKELGFIHHTMITVEKDGLISGMTEMIRMPAKDIMLSQGLTGVKDDQRGRKLGKWLKAKMLVEMTNKYPQVTTITTGNADSNAPMLSINHRLGFKPHKETFLAQIEISKLKTFLDERLAVTTHII